MNHDTAHAALVAAGTLANAQLLDAEGEDLGTLEALLLHADGGRIAFAVVSHGNLFDQGFRHVAVPWDALLIDAEENQVILDVDADRLADAPSFVEGGWPKRADDAWMADLYRHYGLQKQPGGAGRPDGGPR